MGKMKKIDLVFETIIYLGACIFSLGTVYLMKIIIKKAVIEANEY